MQLENKYKNWYYKICHNAQNRNWSKKTAPYYVEIHHIIPRACGGSNEKNNLVCLTPKEHYICHLLLPKFYQNEYKYKMLYGLHMMMKMHTKKQLRYKTDHFLTKRILLSIPKTEEHKRKISESNKGKKKSFQHRQKMSETQKGKLIGENNHFYGKKHSEETRKIIQEKRSKQTISEETKEKMRQSHLKRYKENPELRLKVKNQLKNSTGRFIKI